MKKKHKEGDAQEWHGALDPQKKEKVENFLKKTPPPDTWEETPMDWAHYMLPLLQPLEFD